MSPIFWASYGVEWLVIGALTIMVILMYRHFGLMIMPGGQRMNYSGLDVGARAPALPLRLDGLRSAAYDWASADRARNEYKATFALFAMPACPLCDALSREDAQVPFLTERYPSIRFLWIDSGDQLTHQVSGGWTVASSPNSDAHNLMEVPGSPFSYLVSQDARILAKGLVNDATDIEAVIASSGHSQTPTAGEIRLA
jgi:hypothetical protein